MRCRPFVILVPLALGIICALGSTDAQRPAHGPRLGFLGYDSSIQAQQLQGFRDE